MKELIVENNDNIRLDSYIANENSDLSRAVIQKLLEDGNILVNDVIKKSSYKVKKGDVIKIEIPEPKESKIEAQDIPIEIVYEDNDIIVVNKPKGLVVHPANGNEDGTLVNAIMNICKDSLSGIGGEKRPGIVHRLDKDTSGLLIVAKNDKAHLKMSEQIKDRKVNNGYDEEFVYNVESFNELIFQKYIGNHSNFVYSPSNLYSSLHFLSLGSSKEANNILNNVLGSDNETRNLNYRKYFKNNYFVNENGISEIYNGFFIN